jgi:hypothetical protein
MVKTYKWANIMTIDELRDQTEQIEKRVKDHKVLVESIL